MLDYQHRPIVVMGVSGVGKNTIGSEVARRLGVDFCDADSLHSPRSIARMRAGTPLDDRQRQPWLRAVARWLHGRREIGGVMACSALKRRHRDLLREGVDGPLYFLHLAGDREMISARLAGRVGHFAPPLLLESQLATLEELQMGEEGATLGIEEPPEAIVERALTLIGGRRAADERGE